MNASVPIQANGIIPVAPADVANIPSIALSIPDFEGQAILRVFANSTQSQIGCFSAVITNGSSFSHPGSIGTILGVFAFIALVSSVAVAIYGQDPAETRKHYAHSLSVLVVFAVFQHIYFTGALSMNWPSVLVAWWSNFAWSGGMIYSEAMQNTINRFIGSNGGNISMVGSAPTGQNAPGLGGGFSLTSIYKRAEDTLARRAGSEVVSQFSWYGQPVRPGLPLPGNYSGFAGTLAPENVPASNAFMTGLLWFLILVVIIAAAMVLLKFVIEALVSVRLIKTPGLNNYRSHWMRYVASAVLRTCFIGFFTMMFLTIFQFTLGGSTGVLAVAGVVFALFLLGMIGAAAYALYYRLRANPTKQSLDSDQTLNSVPVATTTTRSWKSILVHPSRFGDANPRSPHVHDDWEYTSRFGWLSARFRRSKWWFFAFWIFYELVRACFFGGAAGQAQTQVFGLLAWEILAFVAVVWMRPFESNRLNMLMVYCLGLSKVASVALSSAFDPRFGLSRILTTVIGIIIIVIQGILTIILLIFIIMGAISSYMSILRNRTEIHPRDWNNTRARYFTHMDYKDTDKPQPPPPPPPPEPEKPKEPYFAVTQVRRAPKIEDDGADDEKEEEIVEIRQSVDEHVDTSAPTRTMSMRSSYSNLPYGARRHRTSWSAHDFADLDHSLEQIQPHSRMSVDDVREVASRHRAASLRGPHPAGFESPTGFSATAQRAANCKSGHRRAMSNPHRSKRNSSVVAEENDASSEQAPLPSR